MNPKSYKDVGLKTLLNPTNYMDTSSPAKSNMLFYKLSKLRLEQALAEDMIAIEIAKKAIEIDELPKEAKERIVQLIKEFEELNDKTKELIQKTIDQEKKYTVK